MDFTTDYQDYIPVEHVTANTLQNFSKFNKENCTTARVISSVDRDLALIVEVGDIYYRYLGPSICIIGIICNIMNLLILTQRQLKESPYTYLTGLAFTDLGALTLSAIFLIGSYKETSYFWKFYDAFIYLPFSNICSNASVWITVVLTIERFLFVRFPLWAKAKLSPTSAKIKIAIIVIAMFIINIPHFLILEVGLVANTTNEYERVSTDFRHSQEYLTCRWILNIVVHFILLVILINANSYLIYAVMKARKDREIMQLRNNKEETWHKEQVRLTITLISIVCLFIVCIIPSAFSNKRISYAIFGGKRKMEEFVLSAFYNIQQYIANTLVWCNLSLNFLFYCAFSNKFRHAMRGMIRRWKNSLCRKNNVLVLVNFRKDIGTTKNSPQQERNKTVKWTGL